MKSAELRSILKKHKISYPAEAKKKELVSIFWNATSSQKPIQAEEPVVEGPTKKKVRKRRGKNKAKATADSKTVLDAEVNAKEESGSIVEPLAVSEEAVADSSASVPAKISKAEKVLKPIRKSPETPTRESQKSDNASKSFGSEKPGSTASKKRRSMLLEVGIPHSDSPSKGNVFEIDSDSETDVLSPRKKKLKPDLLIAASPNLSKLLKSPSTPTSKSITPRKQATNSLTRTPLQNARSTPDTAHSEKSKSNSPDAANVLETSSEIPSRSTVQQSSSPVPSSRASLANSISSKSDEGSQKPHSAHSSFDTASSFDRALNKLKPSSDSSSDFETSSREKQDEDLAKLLGVDIHSVKPKPKGRRSITPRRPIYILKAELSRLRDEAKNQSQVEIEEIDTVNILDDANHSDSSLCSDADIEQPKKPFSSSVLKFFFYLLLWLSVVGSLLYTYWFREQTLLVGYCGHEINQRTIPKTDKYPSAFIQFGEYLDDNFKPNCVDCPQHARCFPHLEIACYDDFMPYAPWYYRYIPFVDPKAQKCIPDTKKAEKIESMIDISLDLLRARNANIQCGRSSPEDMTAGISLSDLHDLLLSLKAPYITVEEFEELWERSVVELEKEPEIIVRQVTIFDHTNQSSTHTNIQVGLESSESSTPDNSHNAVETKNSKNKVFRSTSLSHLSFKCLMSNTIVSILMKFKMAVFIAASILLVSYGGYWKYQQSQVYAQKIETIYKEVLNKLQRQARLAQESSELPAFIGSIQLRDLILSSDTNLAYKMRLWEGISRKVDKNTNVKSELLEVHGEVMKVWQWIGSRE